MSTRFLHGVDGKPTDDSLLPASSTVVVLAATRDGRTATPVPPPARREKCKDAPCLVPSNHIEKPRTAIYVRSSLTYAVLPVSGIVAGPLECCAVTIQLSSVDTIVASVYVRPRLSWDASRMKRLFQDSGLHLALDVLLEDIPRNAVIIFYSKVALLSAQRPEKATMGTALLATWLEAIQDGGHQVSMHWLPASVGIPGNEEADTLAKGAHRTDPSISTAVIVGKTPTAPTPPSLPSRRKRDPGMANSATTRTRPHQAATWPPPATSHSMSKGSSSPAPTRASSYAGLFHLRRARTTCFSRQLAKGPTLKSLLEYMDSTGLSSKL
ncbi:hypothetical protein MRX96_037110 [Rhipicephalus microplus]